MENGLVENFDILIVGASLAGLLQAIELKKRNYSVLILEKDKSLKRPVCGEYLSPEGVKLIFEMGYASLFKDQEKVFGMDLVTPSWKKVETFFPLQRWGLSLNRKTIHERLLAKYLRLSGKIYFDEGLTSIQSLDEQYESETRSKKIHSKVIIGADGRNSKVAKIMSMKTIPLEQKRMALHVYLRPLTPLSRSGQMHILPNGSYVGINPISDNEVNFSIVADVDDVKAAGGPKNYLNSWIKQGPFLKKQFPLITREEIKTTFPISRNSIEIVKDQVALIGDASGFIDPLTGEGMTTAIKTVKMLSEEIDRSGINSSAFTRYEIRRKTDFFEKEKLNRGFQHLIQNYWACEVVFTLLTLSSRLRTTFIGIIGNIYTPSEGVKLFLRSIVSERSPYVASHRRANRISGAQVYSTRDHVSASKDVA